MASILDLFSTKTGEDLVSKISNHTSEEKNQVTSVLGMALPTLLGAMLRNIRTEEGAKSLNNALGSEDHGEFYIRELKNANASQMSLEGDKILDHILGHEKTKITKTISDTLQIKETSVLEITRMAAPLLLSILASQKKKEKIDIPDLENLLKSVMGNSTKYDNSLIEALLNKDGDIQVIKDVEGMILGGGTKGNKDGGILGGMLGGK